ncbi:MAG: bifunctional riboflavin kinase/FAD synthetase [Verrucomicrobiota bacterium]|jgi:riboflavin kinase/FMN adenylyltransferase
MNVIHAAADLDAGPGGVCLAIGVFDGVHLGHQSVIGRACQEARQHDAMPVVVTFDRHPNAVVAPQNVPPLIYPLSKKLRVLESLGLGAACVIHFDKAFSEITGEQFIRGLARDFKAVRAICVGETFQFGHRRSGNVALLQALGGELGFAAHALPDVLLGGKPVSSTRIREAVRAPQFDAASQMLGRPYTLCGPVVAGARLGQKLGFPTANLNVSGILIPPAGVYAADARWSGETRRAAVNIGRRPTMYSSEGGLCVEAHLLDFAGNVYGQEIELTFLGKLREERRFPSVAALQQQIERDVAAARAIEK